MNIYIHPTIYLLLALVTYDESNLSTLKKHNVSTIIFGGAKTLSYLISATFCTFDIYIHLIAPFAKTLSYLI
jgi:hypothetical protein